MGAKRSMSFGIWLWLRSIDLFASMFLHGGLLHLAGNMLFLWIYGDNLEHRLGPLSFLFWYLATGVAATAFQTVFTMGSNIPMVGASVLSLACSASTSYGVRDIRSR